MLGRVLWITALAGMGGTGLGGLLSCGVGRRSGRVVSLLLSFAAGVMVAVVCCDLLADAAGQTGSWLELSAVAGGVLGGFGLTGALHTWLDRRQDGARSGLFWAGIVMAAAIALHNLPEGMVIGASFARRGAAGGPDRAGLVMAAVIGFHNVPEGMAVTVPLVSGGAGRCRAVAAAALTGAPTVLGAWLGYCLGTLGPGCLAAALSLASGAMLYVVFGQLLPESTALWRSRESSLAAVLGVLAGMWLVYV